VIQDNIPKEYTSAVGLVMCGVFAR
jgi:hypothetical protein